MGEKTNFFQSKKKFLKKLVRKVALFYIFVNLFFFGLFMAAPTAYGGSQALGVKLGL